MLAVVLYSVAAFGFAYIVGHAKITAWFRDMLWHFGGAVGHWTVELLECPACLGWWTGFFFGVAGAAPSVHPVALGLFTCGSNYLLGRATGLIK